MKIHRVIARFGYPLCSLVLTIHIILPRLRLLGTTSLPSTLMLTGYCTGMIILGGIVHRRRGRTRIVFESYLIASWIPVLWLSLTTHHHSYFPFPVLFLTVSILATVTAASLKSWSSGPFLGVLTIVCLIMLLDILIPTSKPPVILDKRPEIFAIPDSLLGYKPAPGTEVKITCWKDGEIVYHVRYHFDEFSRRIVPRTAARADSTAHHVIFMGGSCTFGENIDDRETLPARFSTLNPSYAVYNYAFIGYGPQQMLAMLESGLLRDQIVTSRGVLLYGVIPDHVRRASGSYTSLSWGRDFPRYIRSGGELKRVGSFAESSRRLTTFYDNLRLSPSLDYLAKYLDTVLSFKPSRWSHFLDIMEASRFIYREQFHGELTAFFWPLTPRPHAGLQDSVRSRGIPVLDLPGDVVQLDDDSLFVPYDVHPSGLYNEAMAGAITRALIGLKERDGEPWIINGIDENIP